MAWRVEWMQNTDCNLSSEEHPWEIKTTFLAAMGRMHKRDVSKTWNTEEKSIIGSKTSDQRCMAVVGFVPLCSRGDTYPSGHYVALTAMSEGSLKVNILDSARKSDDTFGRMLPVAELRYHVRPILSLATIAVPADTQLNNSVILACSGATNGEIEYGISPNSVNSF